MKKLLAAAISSFLIMTACVNASERQESEKESSLQSSVVSSELPEDSSGEISLVVDSSTESIASSQEQSLPEVFDSPLCRSSLLYCVDDDTVLYRDSPDIRTAPASITKLLTASVVLRNMKPDDVIEVGSELDLVHDDSSRCFISAGNRLKVYDLLTGMLLCSGNDAAYTAAVTTARATHPDQILSDQEAVEVFVAMMNETAAEIGMANSHFATPDGWDDDDQYVTAEDLITLGNYALSVPEIRSIVGIFETYVVFESGENITWKNTNYLLDPDNDFYCADTIGMKTGTTDNAGYCLLSAFRKNGKTYLSAVLGCLSDNDRYELTLQLYHLI